MYTMLVRIGVDPIEHHLRLCALGRLIMSGALTGNDTGDRSHAQRERDRLKDRPLWGDGGGVRRRMNCPSVSSLWFLSQMDMDLRWTSPNNLSDTTLRS